MALVSSKDVAAALNVTVRRVEQLVHEGMPRADRGKYDLGKCLLWYVRFLQRALEKRVAGRESSPDLSAAKARLAVADADLREIELAEKRGRMVAVDDVAPLWEDAVTRMRSRLISSGRKNAPLLVGLKTNAQAEDAVIRIVYEGLAELVQLADDVEAEASEAQAALERDREAERAAIEADREEPAENESPARPAKKAAAKAKPKPKAKGAARGRR